MRNPTRNGIASAAEASPGTASQTTFPTLCPTCGVDLNGYLVRQRLLSPHEVAEMFGGLITERVARMWFRKWCPSGVLGGRRYPVVEARAFAAAFEAQREACDAPRSARPRKRTQLQTTCSRCSTQWGGFLARFRVRSLRQVVPEVGAGFHADTLMRWIRRGEMRAYRLPGVRGPVVDTAEFATDLNSLCTRSFTARALAPWIREASGGEE